MKKCFLLLGIVLILGCSKDTSKNATSVNELADSYYAHFIQNAPEYTYFFGIPLEDHAGISSNKLEDIKLWEAFEDSIYAELSKIDTAKIEDKIIRITYWSLKELLDSDISMRICKRNLWNVNPYMGWQVVWTYIANFQPVGSEELRLQALERWNKFPAYINTEIENLKTGLSQGYSMPKEIVDLVIDQLQSYLDYDIEESPFMSPALRDTAKVFQAEWKELVGEKIYPSISKYLDFLKNDYRDAAREEASLLALPRGDECYQAFIKMETTTNQTGEEIFEQGKTLVSENKNKVISIGSELYQTKDFVEIIAKVNGDSTNYFQSEDEILTVCNHLLSKAKEECTNLFDIMPSTECVIKPYEAYEIGIGGYEPAWGESAPYFRISLKNPEAQQKGRNEILVFHEVYPGHHLQIGIEKDIEGLHPISNLIRLGSYVEGWARYSEQLAEEMGLYQSKAAMINRRAWPARGMVVDPGVHLFGWTKEQAITYIMESGWGKEDALAIYQRIIIDPAQLTSYDVGGEEIKSLRILAEKKLGQRFDIKEFHAKILENGKLPLSALRSIIEEWIKKSKQ